jgi:hypothetical protein
MGVDGAFVIAADEAREFFKVLPGRPPPTTIGCFGRRIFTFNQPSSTVRLDSGIPCDELDLRLEYRPALKPVHTVNSILLGRPIRRIFGIGPGGILQITPVYWEFPIIDLKARPLIGGVLRNAGKVTLCVA